MSVRVGPADALRGTRNTGSGPWSVAADVAQPLRPGQASLLSSEWADPTSTTLGQVVRVAGSRRSIEEGLEEAKGEVGLEKS